MQAFLGLVVLIGVCWLCSENRQQVSWRFVATGLLIQVILGVIFLQLSWVSEALLSLNHVVGAIERATLGGTSFLFGFIGGAELPAEIGDGPAPYIFAFRVLPQVVVFSAVVALLWYWQILPTVIRGLSWLLARTLHVSGAISTAAAASLFLGTIESSMVVRAYLSSMTRSELFTLMTLGMSTIAGSVMILFATILNGVVPGVIGHILTASIINSVGALYVAQLLIPNDGAGATEDGSAQMDYESSMDAITRGTQDGLALAVNIAGMLLVLISFVTMGNIVLEFVHPELSFQSIIGLLFAPVAWLIGIPWAEAGAAGTLLGTKLVLNELIAYLQLAEMADVFSEHSRVILLYALCGFANVGSLGILMGGLSVLVPQRKADYLYLAPRAVLAGTVVTLITGALVGLINSV